MKNKNKGFTLIELVITMLILVIVFGMLSGLIGFATRFYSDESSQVSRQESLRIFAVTFEKDVRKLVDDDDLFTSYTFGTITSYVLGDTSTTNSVRYDFNSSDGKIYRIVGVDSKIIASDIDDVVINFDLDDIPHFDFYVKALLDGRGTLNEVSIVIYPRLLTLGG